MSFQFNPMEKEKYLEIARLLYEKTPLNYIARDLKTSGKIIGMVKKLMDGGFIAIDPETHAARFTAEMDKIEQFLDELHWQKTGKHLMRTPTLSAADAVEKVIKEETAKEATERAMQYVKIGKEVAAAYWKWAQCIAEGQIVIGNPEIQTVECVKPKTTVLGVDGIFHEVLAVSSRSYEGEMIEIRTKMLPFPLKLTPEHAVLSMKPFVVKLHKDYRVTPNQKFAKCFRLGKVIDHFSKVYWRSAEQIEKGDYLLVPIIKTTVDRPFINISNIVQVIVEGGRAHPIGRNQFDAKFKNTRYKSLPDRLPLNDDFMRLCGYYIAEGSISRSGVSLSFNIKETGLVEDVKEIADKFGFSVSTRTYGGAVRVEIYSALLAKIFESLFGRGATEKRFPGFFLTLPLQRLEPLIFALFKGDGDTSVEKIGGRSFRYTTASKTLAIQLFLILLRFGIVPCLSVHKQRYYRLRIRGHGVKRMCEIMKVNDTPIRRTQQAFIFNGFLYLPVKSVQRIKYSGKVYDLRVKDANSFTANLIAVHNSMGIPLEQAVKHDISRIVSEALEYHAKGKQLESRVAELEDALRMLAKQVDPIVRLKNASNLIVRFLEFATLAELIGFEIEGSSLVKHYERVITGYLQGGFA